MQRVQAESRAAVQAAQASKEKEVAQVTVLLHQSQSHAREIETKALQEKLGLRMPRRARTLD
tara:strand:- start:135 stop:320 length:186 start_codon:yes stop_codon:yes gene_type:complete